MSASEAEPLVPTFTGFVQNSMDGLILFEACLSGKLEHVPRRPHDRERRQLIKSGNIFIYEENTSGIKRWTDGVAWSPSRILDNFLIYRELDKTFPPGEKKRAIKRKRGSHPRVDGFQRGNPASQENVEMPRPTTPPEALVNEEVNSGPLSSTQDKELERSLIGSLVDSYDFRADGLVKKTMSISVNGVSHHMVSYYKVDDVKHNVLARPLRDPRLQHISVRRELYLKQNFRVPIEETEHYAIDGQAHAHHQMMYSMAANGQNMRPGQYYPAGQYPGMYAPMTTSNAGHAAMYNTMPGTQWAQQPGTAYGGHPGSTAASFYGRYYRSGSQSEAKPAESHTSSRLLGYNNSDSASYSGECHGSHRSSGMMLRSPFQSPVQGRSSTLGSVGAPTGRSSCSGGSKLSPTSNYQFRQMHSAPQESGSFHSQQHALFPQIQSHGMQGVPQSSTTKRLPHVAIESPPLAVPSSSIPVQTMAHDPPRYRSYVVPHSAYRSSDTNSLGTGGGANYAHSYDSFGQTFRPADEAAETQAGTI